MRFKLLIGTGCLLILAGLIGFLASSVALAGVRDVPGVARTDAGRLELSPDNPLVAQRQSQAERVLLGSLLTGASGILFLGGGLWVRKHARGQK